MTRTLISDAYMSASSGTTTVEYFEPCVLEAYHFLFDIEPFVTDEVAPSSCTSTPSRMRERSSNCVNDVSGF